jgi:UDP-glucose 4-epimerase
MKVLVTGGAGFIGANLCRRLVSAGVSVVVLDDLSTGLSDNLEEVGVELVLGSVLDSALVSDLAQRSDAIFHLAARGSVPRSVANPRATFDVNGLGTLNVLEAAREYKLHTVVASSSSVYGANDSSPKSENTWVSPLSPYAASKVTSEAFAQSYAASYGLPITIFRFFNVYGPWQRPDHQYAAVIPKWIRQVVLGQPVEIHGDGEQSRDFTFVDTVIEILMETLFQRVTRSIPVNLAFGSQVSLRHTLQLLSSIMHTEVDFIHTPSREGDIRHSLNDPSLIRMLFPNVKPVAFTDGLSKTVNWVSQYYGAPGYTTPLT